MDENYINIYSSFLAGQLEKGNLQVKDIYLLMSEFEPVCEAIQSRKDLVGFIEKYLEGYPKFKVLKEQLLDNKHLFVTEVK